MRRFQNSKTSKWLNVMYACTKLGAVAACFAIGMSVAPASAKDISPEIYSRVWVENDSEVAAVSVNGKDLISFKAPAGTGRASEEAEDLAIRLQELVNEKGFDADLLLPAKDGDKLAIKMGASTVASCEFLPARERDKESNNAMFDAGLKLVNGLRAACGSTALPNCATLASGGQRFSGQASWYGPQFHGRKCSDGSRFDMEQMTAAHRSLPFGTKLLVTNRKTGDSCVVKVNDRGPFIDGRVIDLSRGAARQLHMLSSGVAMVDCVVIGN